MSLKGKGVVQLYNAKKVGDEWVPTTLVAEEEFTNDILYSRLEQYVSEQSYNTFNYASSESYRRLFISEQWNEGPYHGLAGGVAGIYVDRYETEATDTEGSYWTFKYKWDPHSMAFLEGLTDISFNDTAGTYTIDSVSTDLSVFAVGDPILIETTSGTNNGRYHIVAVTANRVTVDKPLVTETAVTAGTTMLRSSRWWRSLGLENMTVVNLGNAFEQTNRQILFVTYRLYNYDEVTDTTGYEWSKSLFASLFKFGPRTPSNTGNTPYDDDGYPRNLQMQWYGTEDIDPDFHAQYSYYRRDKLDNTVAPTYHSLVDGTYEKRGDWTDLNTYIGELYGSCFIGYGGYLPSHPASVRKPGQTSVQNVYLRNELSVLPYLDIENIGTSTGTVTVDDSAGWTDNHGLAAKYRFKVTTGGNETAAQYKLYKRMWSGTTGNNQTPRGQWLGKSTISNYAQHRDNNTVRPNLNNKQYWIHGQGMLQDIGYIYPTTTENYNGHPRDGSNDAGHWYNPYFQQYIFPEFISASPKGLAICHTNKAPQILDATSNVVLPVSDVRQIEHLSDGTIFVACARTGLWKIGRDILGSPQASNYTITRVEIPNAEYDKACNGVQIKHDGTIWAYVGREMCKSTDAGATWTIYNESTPTQFSIPSVTDSLRNGQRVICIIVDKHTTNDDRFVIRLGGYPSHFHAGNQFSWWSTGGTDAQQIDPNDGVTVLKAAGVSDYKMDDCGLAYGSGGRLYASKATHCKRDGEWIFYKPNVWNSSGHTYVYTGYQGTRQNFGGSHSGYSTNSKNCLIGWGIQVIYDEATDKEYLISRGASTSTTITANNPYGRNFRDWMTLHDSDVSWTGELDEYAFPLSPVQGHRGDSMFWYVGEGCALYSGYYNQYNYWAIQHLSGDPLTQGMDCGLWETYGWNGSSWVKNHAGSKPVHASTDSLIDGLTVSFGAGDYVNGEYYDAYVYDGILKDNATKFQYYTNVIKLNSYETSEFSAALVPAVDENNVTESLCVAEQVYHGYANSSSGNGWLLEGRTTDHLGWHEPGVWSWGSSRTGALVAQQQLVGDFTISFRITRNDLDKGSNTYPTNLSIHGGYVPIPTRFCLREWTNEIDVPSFYGSLPWVSGDIPYPETLEIENVNETTCIVRVRRLDAWTGSTSGMWTNNGPATVHHAGIQTAPLFEQTIYDRDISDVVTIRRIAGAVRYEYNGQVLYTSSITDNRTLQFYTMHGNSNYMQLKDAIVTYNNPNRMMRLGKQANFSGSYDPNFRKVLTAPNVRTDLNHINLDGTPAVINYDALTPPAPGEVTLHFNSGKLWFNDADSGKAVTGALRYTRILNAKDATGILNNPVEIIVTVAQDTNFWGTGNKFLYNGSLNLPAMVPGNSYRFNMEDPSCAGYVLRVSLTPNGSWTTGGVEYIARSIIGTPGNIGAYTQVTVPNTGKLHVYATEEYGMGNPPIDKASVPAASFYTVTVSNNKFVIDGTEAPVLPTLANAMIVLDTSDASNTGTLIGLSNTLDGMLGGGLAQHIVNVGTPGSPGSFTVINVGAMSALSEYYYGNTLAAGYGNSFDTYFDDMWDQVVYLLDGSQANTTTLANYSNTADTFSVAANVVVRANTDTSISISEIEFHANTTDEMIVFNKTYPFQPDQGGRTFEFWMYPYDDMDTVDQVVFDDTNDVYFRPGSNNGARTGIQLHFMDANYYDTIPASQRIPQNQWSHIVIQTDDNPYRKTDMWVNGERVFSFTGVDTHDGAPNIRMGNYARAPSAGYAFNGKIAGIRHTWEARYPDSNTIAVPTRPYPKG